MKFFISVAWSIYFYNYKQLPDFSLMQANLWEVLILISPFRDIIASPHQNWQENCHFMKSAYWPQTRLKGGERCNFQLYQCITPVWRIMCFDEMSNNQDIIARRHQNWQEDCPLWKKCRVVPDQTEPHHPILAGNEMHRFAPAAC